MEFSVSRLRLIAKLVGDISFNNVSDSNEKMCLSYPPKILEFHLQVKPK